MIAGRQVVDLDGARRDWVCLVVLGLLVALSRLPAGWAQGGDDGRLAGTVYSCSMFVRHVSYRGILALGLRILAFVSSLPQVGGVGGGWRMDVVVRASLS